MRILFATAHKHVPERWGGMEINTDQLAVELQKRGIAVAVLCGLAGKGTIGLRDRIRIRLLHDACPRDRVRGYPTWRAWNPVPFVHRVADAFHPDVIVVQGGDKFAPLVEASLRLGGPVLGYLHTPDPSPLGPRTLADPHLFFVANSKFTASLQPEKPMAAVIRPLVYRKHYETKTSRSAAVFVNPAPYKGLAIVSAIAASRPDVKFLFVRVIPPKPRDAQQDHAKLPPNVELIGPFRDMREVYRRAKVLLAPSVVPEPWGRVVTEAHINGIPVLASDRGGLPEAVGPGGICLSPDAPLSQWKNAFDKMWDDAGFYAGLSAQARSYSERPEVAPERIVESFAGLCSSLVAGATNASEEREPTPEIPEAEHRVRAP